MTEYDTTELPPHPLDHLGPGDIVTIHEVEFRVKSIGRGLSPSKELLYLTLMATDRGGPMTDGTISILFVGHEPYVLDICNGPKIDIRTDEVGVH